VHATVDAEPLCLPWPVFRRHLQPRSKNSTADEFGLTSPSGCAGLRGLLGGVGGAESDLPRCLRVDRAGSAGICSESVRGRERSSRRRAPPAIVQYASRASVVSEVVVVCSYRPNGHRCHTAQRVCFVGICSASSGFNLSADLPSPTIHSRRCHHQQSCVYSSSLPSRSC
jgi:hypothetical protein